MKISDLGIQRQAADPTFGTALFHSEKVRNGAAGYGSAGSGEIGMLLRGRLEVGLGQLGLGFHGLAPADARFFFLAQ